MLYFVGFVLYYICHTQCSLDDSTVHAKVILLCNTIINSSISARSGDSQLRWPASWAALAEQSVAQYRGGWRTQEASFDISHLCVETSNVRCLGLPTHGPLNQDCPTTLSATQTAVYLARLERPAQEADRRPFVLISGGFREGWGWPWPPIAPTCANKKQVNNPNHPGRYLH